MKAAMHIPDDYELRQIKGFGAKPGIKTALDYVRSVENGVAAAKSVADGFTSGPWVDSGQVTTLHWAAYREIYPWAGQFRTVELLRKGATFSSPDLIRSDLRSLNIAAREWFQSDDLHQTAKEIAAYNAAFYKIHPFLEGSALVGKLILENQVKELFGREINLDSDRKVYWASRKQALEGNYSPLASQILEHSGLGREAEINAVERMMRDATKKLKEQEEGIERSF